MSDTGLQRIADKRGFSGTIKHEDRETVRDAAHALGITLDGRRATLTGTGLDFAQVSTLGKGPSYTIEWAWQSAARIILGGGRFKS